MAACRRVLGVFVSASRQALNLSSARTPSWADRRALLSSAAAGASDYLGELDDINSKFAEAREEIEMAVESKDTVYFDEEAQTARDAVKLVLDKYQGLLARLPDSDKGALQRSMGLKMEQLKAELDQLNA